jgi:hypothetical protein
MTSIPLDGEIRDGRHVLTVRVYYEDTDFTGPAISQQWRHRHHRLRLLAGGGVNVAKLD